MTSKLNLTIEKEIVNDIKKYAKKHNRSVSEIVEDQLKSISNKHSLKAQGFSEKYAGIIKGKKFDNLNQLRDKYLKEKYDLLARAHILINPSIREGWGLVVIEAASVKTPTVGYNVPGLKDSIKDNETGLLSNANPKDSGKDHEKSQIHSIIPLD